MENQDLVVNKNWINPDPNKIIVCSQKMNNEENLTVLLDTDTQDIYFISSQLAKYLDYDHTNNLIRNMESVDFKHSNMEFLNKINGLEAALGKPIAPRGLTLINESGFYSVAFKSSSKPEIVNFRNWVTKEVLPTIRKTGGYNINQTHSLTSEEFDNLLNNALQPLLLKIEDLTNKTKPTVKMDNFDPKELIGGVDCKTLAKRLNKYTSSVGFRFKLRFIHLTLRYYDWIDDKTNLTIQGRCSGFLDVVANTKETPNQTLSKSTKIIIIKSKIPEFIKLVCIYLKKNHKMVHPCLDDLIKHANEKLK